MMMGASSSNVDPQLAQLLASAHTPVVGGNVRISGCRLAGNRVGYRSHGDRWVEQRPGAHVGAVHR